MKIIQKFIYGGFAAVAFVSASMPVLSVAAYPGVLYGPDFAWYAQVGHRSAMLDGYEVQPPPRDGHIWSPGRWEWNGYRHTWVAAHWVRDDYAEQVALAGPASRLALTPIAGPDGNVAAYVLAPRAADTLRR